MQLARQNPSEEQLSTLLPEPVTTWSSQTITHDWPTPVTHSSPASSLPPLDEGDPQADADAEFFRIVKNPAFSGGDPDLDGSDEMEGSPQSNIANMDTDIRDEPGWDSDFLPARYVTN